ncbi:hypothetical protein HUA78_44925 [Myxococcus sp. CA033]|uniref:hypothetical protein n=1 Tax=Myxococcus sp. CA033 TaxID=2741516 RepID=UPI00157B2CE3|nr:hypothetical protein [Myxococcus sp. CA033]NTX41598.1 hypothetical protein [Myxococcus sp. CA033]
MIIKCKRCHENTFVFEFESKKMCRRCIRLVARGQPTKGKFKYGDNKLDHHKQRVQKVDMRVSGISKTRHTLRRTQSAMTLSEVSGSGSGQGMIEEPITVDDTAPYIPPSVMRLQCMTLFIPFDAGNNFYKTNAKKGTFQADFIPQRDNHFASTSAPTTSRALSSLNTSVYPGQQVFEARSTPMTPTQIEGSYDNIVLKHIMACTNSSEWKRVHAASPIDLHVQLSRLCPEVIFLSEELKDAPFPKVLQPCPELRYRKIGSIKDILGPDAGVDAKNEIAAYALVDEKFMSHVLYDAKVLFRQGVKHKEKWLCVQKISPEFQVHIDIAGVHLDAGYTGFTSDTKKQQALAAVGEFARQNDIDALLGDLNMDSFELNGGFFPNQFNFTTLADNTVKPTYTLSHSNTNSQNNYMGGLIANTDQVETEAMNLRGEDTVSLSRTLDGKFYSDHPAIMANYFKSFHG